MCGSITDRYRQVGNAVPVGLGETVGRAILAHIKGVDEIPPPGFSFSRYKDTDHVSWEAKMIKTIESNKKPKVRPMASQKKQSIEKVEDRQILLFAPETIDL